VTLRAEELYVFAFVSDKLLRNSSIALGQQRTRDAADEINFKIGDAILNGNGSSQPKGLVGAAGTIDIAKENGQTATTIVTENIDKMWARITPRARANAIWLINVDTEPELQNLTQDVGTGGVPLMRESIREGQGNIMKGRPVVPCEYCQTLGTSGDIILADLRFYMTGTRGGIQGAESIHLKFDYNQTAFRFIFEVDGQPWLPFKITPFKGTNTQAPFLTLATRS
jgi:HK97 family phage major capsid protein